MDALRMLTADLRHIERLVDAVASAEVGSDHRPLVERLGESVERHLQFEESWIDPLMARINGQAASVEARRRALRASLATLRETTSLDDLGSSLERLRSEVDRHVEDDELTTFPTLRAACPQDLLDDLGAEMRRSQESARLDAEDRARAADRARMAVDSTTTTGHALPGHTVAATPPVPRQMTGAMGSS